MGTMKHKIIHDVKWLQAGKLYVVHSSVPAWECTPDRNDGFDLKGFAPAIGSYVVYLGIENPNAGYKRLIFLSHDGRKFYIQSHYVHGFRRP